MVCSQWTEPGQGLELEQTGRRGLGPCPGSGVMWKLKHNFIEPVSSRSMSWSRYSQYKYAVSMWRCNRTFYPFSQWTQYASGLMQEPRLTWHRLQLSLFPSVTGLKLSSHINIIKNIKGSADFNGTCVAGPGEITTHRVPTHVRGYVRCRQPTRWRRFLADTWCIRVIVAQARLLIAKQLYFYMCDISSQTVDGGSVQSN